MFFFLAARPWTQVSGESHHGRVDQEPELPEQSSERHNLSRGIALETKATHIDSGETLVYDTLLADANVFVMAL